MTTASPAPFPVSPAPTVNLRVGSGGSVRTVALEDYVLSAALAEVSPAGESAATVATVFDVQTILARTYALAHRDRHGSQGFDLCDTTHCQLYDPARLATSRFAAEARAAAARTRGRVLVYCDTVADAPFHADCGGYTASPVAAWGGTAWPYLLAAPDNVGPETHRPWKTSLRLADLRRALARDTRTDPGRSLTGIEILARDAGGRAVTVRIDGERSPAVRAEVFRSVVNATLGDRTIRSTHLDVARTADGFAFSGLGFGHGVGLCQAGALARARRGEASDAILEAYYQGITLSPVH